MTELELTDKAEKHVKKLKKASIGNLQRDFKIGYNAADRVLEELENRGVVSAKAHDGSRKLM